MFDSSQDKVEELMLCSCGHLGTNLGLVLPTLGSLSEVQLQRHNMLPISGSLGEIVDLKKQIQNVNKGRWACLSKSCEMLPSKVLQAQLYLQRMPARTKDQEHHYQQIILI